MTVGWLAALSLAVPAINYRVDFYGLFDGARGRLHNIYMNERMSKYLMAYNYIPNGFDGVLVGSSISDNWDTRGISGWRIYNASISGGNISEEKLIVDRVLRRGRMRLAIFVLYPYLTVDHGRKSGFMSESDYWGALGSPQLLLGYVSRLLVELGLEADAFNEYGARDFTVEIKPVDVKAEMATDIGNRRRRHGPDPNNAIDPVALEELRALIELARSTGAKVVAVYPPIYRERLALQRSEVAEYQARVRELLRPEDLIIDLNASDELGDLRNFFDTAHLTREGAARAVAAVDLALAPLRRSASSR